ncbi:hypothetical protein M422DRAFT_66486 [Sphaerobolus stellatus SS14]|nr:hypothetical protein M422DRAFT_66486 [Sphaerobolus stellatus SS14]
MPSTRSKSKPAELPTATADTSPNPPARQVRGRPRKQAAKIAKVPSTVQPAEQQSVANPEPVTSESPFGPPPGVGGTSFTPEGTSEPLDTSNGSVASPADPLQLSAAHRGIEARPARPIPFPYSQNSILPGSDTLTAGSDTQANEKRKLHEFEALEALSNPPKRHKPGSDGNDLLRHFERLKNQNSSTGVIPSSITPPEAPNSPLMPTNLVPSIGSPASEPPSVDIPALQIDPALQAIPSVPSTPTIEAPKTVSNNVVTQADERAPGLPVTGKPTLNNATPRTKTVIVKASPYYKIRLITDHPFPESVGRKSRFAEDAWKKAHKVLGLADKILFNSQVEKALHNMGNTFRGSRTKELCSLAVTEYSLEQPLSEVSQRKVEGLLLDGSFTYDTVFFESDGSIMRHSLDQNLLMRQGPPFFHPFLRKIIRSVVYKGRPSLYQISPESFQTIPLETIAYACTLGNFCLKSLLSNDRRLEFCAGDYAPIFNETVLALQNFQCNDPKKFEELQRKFGERSTEAEEMKAVTGTMKGVTRVLSDADIALELENRNRAHSQQIAVQSSSSTAVASANAVHSQATATATVQANTFSVQLPHGAYPHYSLPYGFPGVGPSGMPYPPPPQGSFNGAMPPNQWPPSNGAAPPQA